jgi:hypothetical protein
MPAHSFSILVTKGRRAVGIAIPVVLALALSACVSTSPVSLSEATYVPADRILIKSLSSDVNAGTITFIRDSGMLGAGCNIGVFIDGKHAATLDTGERVAFKVEPGEHIVGGSAVGRALCAGEDDRRETSTFLKPNEQKFFRISVRLNGGLTVEPTTMIKQ